MNSETLKKIVDKAKSVKGTFYKISIVENGVAETAILTPANGAQNSYSVAKAYTVAAIGIAHDMGLIKTDEKVCDILGDELIEGMDSKWQDVTVHHLIKHTAGFDEGYLDIDAVDFSFISDGDYLKYLFETKLEFVPGTEFRYSDAAYYLLSRIISKKTGRIMDEFLLEKLFCPLEFREVAWSRCPKGYTMGATGLYVYAEDLVKLGAVYVNDGIYNGKRIFSKEWIDMVYSRGYELYKTEGGGYAKGGAFGQMLVFYPDKKRAIAYHSYGGDDMLPFIDSLE